MLRRFAATRHCATYRAAAPRDVTYHNATVPISLIALRVAPRRSASRGVATCRHVTLCPSTQRNVFADFSSTAPLLFSSLSHAALPRVTCRISTRHNVISFSAAYRCAARPASRPLGAPHRPATQRNALVYSPPRVTSRHATRRRSVAHSNATTTSLSPSQGVTAHRVASRLDAAPRITPPCHATLLLTSQRTFFQTFQHSRFRRHITCRTTTPRITSPYLFELALHCASRRPMTLRRARQRNDFLGFRRLAPRNGASRHVATRRNTTLAV